LGRENKKILHEPANIFLAALVSDLFGRKTMGQMFAVNEVGKTM